MKWQSDSDTLWHPAAISQVMVNFAAGYQVDIETCLLGTGISPEQLQEADTLIARTQEMRLVENLILALPDVPALGFELGLRYSVATFGIWGFALRTSRSLRDALQHALRYLPLSTAYCRFYIDHSPDSFIVCVDPDEVPAHLREFLFQRDIGTALNLLKELGLSGITPQALHFRGPPVPDAARIEALSGIRPRYRQSRNAVYLNNDDVDRPLPTYDPTLVRMLEDQCRAQLERLQNTGLIGRVRQQLLGPLGLVASLEDVAAALALSPRSLRRKLDEEGSRFRDIVEEERRQLATQLLTKSEMTLDELALQLGYADTASFSRAFRRWFGQSPGEYRKASRDY